MNLMAIVDANYKFISVDVGSEGRHHDGSVWKESSIGKAITARALNIPLKKSIENGPALPYVFIGDEAFQLTDTMMRPYARRSLKDDHVGSSLSKKVFNYRYVNLTLLLVFLQIYSITEKYIAQSFYLLPIRIISVFTVHRRYNGKIY